MYDFCDRNSLSLATRKFHIVNRAVLVLAISHLAKLSPDDKDLPVAVLDARRFSRSPFRMELTDN